MATLRHVDSAKCLGDDYTRRICVEGLEAR